MIFLLDRHKLRTHHFLVPWRLPLDKCCVLESMSKALFDGIQTSHGRVQLVELNIHINDHALAEAAAQKLIQLMKQK